MQQARPPVKKPPLHSVATRVILVVFAATFLTAAVVSGLAVHSTYGFLRAELDEGLPVHAAATAAALGPLLEAARLDVEALASAEALGAAADAAQAELDDALSDLGAVAAACVVDPELGKVAESGAPSLREALGRRHADSDSPLESVAHGTGAQLIVWSLPLDGESGRSLHAVVDPNALAAKGPPAGLAQGVAMLVDDEGGIVWSSHAVMPGARRMRRDAPSDAAAVYADGAGRFVVASAAPEPIQGLHLLVEQPFQVAFAPVFAVLTRVFFADLCIVLFFSFLAYRLTAAIVRPIEALSDGARRISAGELRVELQESKGSDEISLLTRTFNDMTRKLRRQRSEIHSAAEALRERNEQLQRANEVLEQLSITDGLTKLHNHRYFHDFLTREIKRVTRIDEPLCMLLIDIDDFKRLNDRLGHAAGDNLLSGLARILNDATRATDLVARYGGEEFVVLMPGTDLEGAELLAEKIRHSVAEASFILDDTMQLTKMTISLGVAQYRGNRKTFFQAADQALYRAKGAGKNCVVLEPEDEPSSGSELDEVPI